MSSFLARAARINGRGLTRAYFRARRLPHTRFFRGVGTVVGISTLGGSTPSTMAPSTMAPSLTHGANALPWRRWASSTPEGATGGRRAERYAAGIRELKAHFERHWAPAESRKLLKKVDAFLAKQDVARAAAVLDSFFDTYTPRRDGARGGTRDHREPDDLRQITRVFADKRVALNLANSVLLDDELLTAVAAQSYPHPIGFDKLVLVDRGPAGYKLRLHVYWRTPQEIARELIHLHAFEMASAPITGELTNHLYSVLRLGGGRGGGGGGYGDEAVAAGLGPLRAVTAYTGYERDAATGALHKRLLGPATLHARGAATYTPVEHSTNAPDNI